MSKNFMYCTVKEDVNQSFCYHIPSLNLYQSFDIIVHYKVERNYTFFLLFHWITLFYILIQIYFANQLFPSL